MIQMNQTPARGLNEELRLDLGEIPLFGRRDEMKKTTAAVIATFAALAFGTTTLATMEIQKEYKAKDPKANCATCHKEKMPKKGAAELNDFGKTVKAAQGKDGKVDWSKVKAPEKK
jgi:hypothetical protein